MSRTPIIAIIGAPNTGKSTLFNRLIGERRSLESDIAGTTRDSITALFNLANYDIILVDTAGLRNSKGDDLEASIQEQARLAANKADILLYIVDGKKTPTADDEAISSYLRKLKKPFIFIANKVDDGVESRVYEWSELGFGIPIPYSARHGYGLEELEDAIIDTLKTLNIDTQDDNISTTDTLKIAIIGRPNVGKSSLTNTLLGYERSIVSDISGTTRDALDTDIVLNDGRKCTIIDTAGVRKKARVEEDMEYWAVVRSLGAITRSDVCMLLIDALDGMTHQDLTLLGHVLEAGKGLLLVVNKFDLAYDKAHKKDSASDIDMSEVKMWGEDLNTIKKNYLQYLARKVPFASFAPVEFVSAKTGKGVQNLVEYAFKINEERHKTIEHQELKYLVPQLTAGHPTPMAYGRAGTVIDLFQTNTCPPTFQLVVRNPKAFSDSYRRYTENKIRDKYGFHGTAIRVWIGEK